MPRPGACPLRRLHTSSSVSSSRCDSSGRVRRRWCGLDRQPGVSSSSAWASERSWNPSWSGSGRLRGRRALVVPAGAADHLNCGRSARRRRGLAARSSSAGSGTSPWLPSRSPTCCYGRCPASGACRGSNHLLRAVSLRLPAAAAHGRRQGARGCRTLRVRGALGRGDGACRMAVMALRRAPGHAPSPARSSHVPPCVGCL